VRRDEALAEPGEDEPRDGAENERDRAARAAAQSLRACQYAGIDDRLGEPQAGETRHREARQLEQPVGRDEANEDGERAGLDREPGQRAEQQPVVGQHGERAGAAEQSAGEGDEAHPEVVGVDRACQPCAAREPARKVPYVRVGSGAVGARQQADGRSGIVRGPRRGEEGRQQRGEGRDREDHGALTDRSPVAAREEPPQRAAAQPLAVHDVARAQYEQLELSEQRIARVAAPREREVGRAFAMQPAKLHDPVGVEAIGTSPGTVEQPPEPLPSGPARAVEFF